MKRGLSKEDSRPLSWCIGGYKANDLSKCFSSNSSEGENNKDELEQKKENGPLPRGLLVRSTSYQALHSALARLYRLDDFTLERIGQGFFSEVYKARHLVTGKIMVLKMNKLLSNRHNMLREVELMNRLHHPNILNYYGVCVHEGQVHALTQYINGGCLDALLQNLRIDLPWVTRTSLALDIARGISYLHMKRVFHRDLTSKNILIQHWKERGKHRLRAVIGDFGLAAQIPQDKSVRLRQVGSPYWMAPEVIRGDWYDHRVDIFSFGIVVCEIIARCDADPDILPRTHNFGVHYLAFSRMCPNDCPPGLLELAFQCCQIDPVSRPSFKELENILHYLLVEFRPTVVAGGGGGASPRKQKVCHRRSLSDDSLFMIRSHSSPIETKVKETLTAGAAAIAGTPQEVLERISAADPYFQPSSATVNPFSGVKLPAKSQLIVQDGGRYCHSMPADLRDSRFSPKTSSIESSGHLTTSDTSLSLGLSPTHSFKCACGSNTSSNAFINSQSLAPPDGVCSSTSKLSQSVQRRKGSCRCISSLDSACRTHVVKTCSTTRLLPCSWLQDIPLPSGTSSRPDAGGGNPSASATGVTVNGGPIHRRGSGESGFFSVDDELGFSYSELSSASFLSMEDEETMWHSLTLRRSPSVVTDSSEDLSSVGCGASHEQNCEFSHMDGTETPTMGSAVEGGSTDIKSIVEFFERGYGSLRSGMSERSEWNRKLVANARRKECLVPFLRSRFNAAQHHRAAALGNGSGSGASVPTSQSTCICSSSQGGSKISCAKDKCRASCSSSGTTSSRSERREALRPRERPKVYITEGTVRAKRNLFESK
ncbi:Dual specificity testis-specific protein kinase 2 [Armadillidium nasatum]|uniref:dual-specificity kinase n=1 Tax=Armadillidium nasatum TaxID=96803 RepID=A0A5N5SV83_9CRUS|nr:Dual specificity testis-specific protein kinase 2 [Armadillidium nasatum]